MPLMDDPVNWKASYKQACEDADEFRERVRHVVEEYDRWNANERLREQSSLEHWLREDINQLRGYLIERPETSSSD